MSMTLYVAFQHLGKEATFSPLKTNGRLLYF